MHTCLVNYYHNLEMYTVILIISVYIYYIYLHKRALITTVIYM